MGKDYSHSKLSLFESCPEAYKIKYIDKTFPDLPKSVELVLGDFVHQSLEWLYISTMQGQKVELDQLIEKFAYLWTDQDMSEVRFRGTSNESEMMNKGVKILIDYYKNKFSPHENVLALEKEISFNLVDGEKTYRIKGFVDKISLNADNEYEIHDYKTSQVVKKQHEADKDRQLGFYHIGLKNIFGNDIKVKLIWHFLVHNTSVYSQRNEEHLENLKKDTLNLIRTIENNTIWPACGKPWCDWCAYKKANASKEFTFQSRLKL